MVFHFVKRLSAMTIGAILAACSSALGPVNAAEAPDLIHYNGKVVTVDSAFSIEQAVANGRLAV